MPPDQLAETMNVNVAPLGPALSATSDVPKPAPAPTPKPAAEAKKPVVDENVETGDKSLTEGDPPAGKNSEAEGKSPKPDETPAWQKREITIERNKRRAAEERAKQLEADLSRALSVAAKPADAPKTAETEARPSRGDYSDPDAYDDALVAWSSRRAEAETKAKVQRDAQQEATHKRLREIADAWTDRRAEFMADHPDFEEVAEADDLPISITMSNAIWISEEGPAVAYYLGQNPEEAKRIAAMEPLQAIKAIGRIEAKVSQAAPEPRPEPVKPAPIRPVGARTSASTKSPAEESMEEYAARRSKELRSKQ